MHRRRVFPTSCGIFVVVAVAAALIVSHIPTSLGVIDEQYTKCSQNFQCTNITNIGYPFWGGTRPKYCGHPNFGLNCTGEYPRLTILSSAYRVFSIDNTTRTLNVVGEEILRDCCSRYTHNTSLDTAHFDYAFDAKNITLFYDCHIPPGTPLIPTVFACSRNATIYNACMYSTSGTMEYSDVTCNASVIVPVNRGAAQALSGNSINVGEALRSGFGLQWEANDTYCERCVQSGGTCGSDTISSGSFVCYCSDQPYALTCQPSFEKGLNLVTKLVIGFSAGGATILLITTIFCLKRPCTSLVNKGMALRKKESVDEQNVEAFLRDCGSLAPKRYSYSDLQKLTNSFKDKLGQGGYGDVYKGTLSDGHLVAVKILTETKGNGEEFINEVASISRTSHVNVVALLGFCYESNRRALVYEFMAKGSLDKFIYNQCDLELRTLYQIAVGTARGLQYLHQGCNTRIIHFDIKPQNILLDEDLCPKISDFGLAKLCQRKESIISMMGARGTAGYIAPEVISRTFGGVSHKSDVYSYGMLVLDMTGAREKVGGVSQTSEIYFPDWIYEHLERRRDLTLRGVNTTEEEETVRKMILVGLWCIQTNPLDRPPMSRVVEMLEGSLESLQIPPKPILFSPASHDPSGQDSSKSLTSANNVLDMSKGSRQSLQFPSKALQLSTSRCG
ncbi:Leaf rust 10 disease-resistance locus receptor-like protein kinase [Actinidia chinensis var. chinensis]|uniref:non-specific serine/threonine protein kinase n=1 Tax=Actinidia chinensis var. chinensis TaxID=1590841 RepID=A0A2R6RU83_ACTCC|nr:Leaf rust 10 disease-resistance locus receptor-like protein kinase [Actinidia chinensis var. chinensis]